MMKMRALIAVMVMGVTLVGCRGYRTEDQPFHMNPNFDWQAKVKAQHAPRAIPEGTVAWGSGSIYKGNTGRADFLKDDSMFYQGKSESGDFLDKIPVNVTPEVMKRGQERFNIYCAVCHNRAGTGTTPVISRGLVPPPDLADPRLLEVPDGYIFDVISNGVRSMSGYRKQVDEADRWAIVAYVRAIQKSRNASVDELPAIVRGKLQ